jgi:hypothetical protein
MDDFDTQMYDQMRAIHVPGISRNGFVCFFHARMQLVPRMQPQKTKGFMAQYWPELVA